jgi:Ricin-type beta-trefoil lectin domain-like
MFRFMKKLGRDSQATRRGTGPMTRVRRRNHPLNCEVLESRQMLSGYYIANAASGKVLDDPAGSTNEGAVIDQWQLDGGTNQRWNLIPVGNGDFMIQNLASQLVLDNSLSTSNGTVIDQWQPERQPSYNQTWIIQPQPDGNDLIISAYSGQVLDDSGSSSSNGTQLIQYPSNGGSNQEWILLAAGGATASTNYIQNADSGLALDDPGSSTSNGTSVDVWQFNGGANQAWTFVQMFNGNVVIVNDASGLVLEETGSSNNGANLIDQGQLNGDSQAPLDGAGALNQQWHFDGAPTLAGIYTMVNASSGQVLDDDGAEYGNGTLVIDYPALGNGNQDWYFSAGVDIHGQPSNAVVGQPISPAITVAVVDATGNTVTANNTQLVTLAIASGPAGAKLLGTTTVRAVNGVADFTNLTLSLAGTYTLTATGGALTPDFSNVFTVAPVNVTSAVRIHRGSMHKIGRAKASRNGAELVAQTITIKNSSRQPLDGPLALRVGGLPTGVTLANATGTYEGGSYRDVLAALQPLAPGKSVTVTLDFSMSGRRSPSLSNLDEDLEALLGI